MSSWTKHELEQAAWLCSAATLSDESTVPIDSKLRERGWKLLTIIRNTDTDIHAYLAKDGLNNMALVFRCTASWTNVKTDLEADPEEGMGVTIHGGFWRGYQSISKQVHAALLQYPVALAAEEPFPISAIRGGPVSLLVVGHSLGGALASLAALDLTFTQFAQNVGLITLGSPRVGLSDFVEMFESRMGRRYVRVMFQNDLVAQVPTSPYKHTGGLLHIDAGGNELGTLRKGWLLVRNWICSFFRFAVTLAKWESLSDHALKFYQDGIRAMNASWEREL